jgi:hypothetical protein
MKNKFPNISLEQKNKFKIYVTNSITTQSVLKTFSDKQHFRRIFVIWLCNFYVIFASLNQFLLNWGLGPVDFGTD